MEHIEISELVEDKLQETYQQVREKSRKSGIPWRRMVAAVALFGLMLTSFGTAYAMSNGYSVNDLFTKLWGYQTSQSAIEQVSGEVQIIEENCTFQDISIEPVRGVVDRLGSYIVLRVTGKNGFFLEDDMTFGEITTEYGKDVTGSLNGYVLKREKNVMYYALWNLLDQPEKEKKNPIFHIETFNLVSAEFYEDGSISYEKTSDGARKAVGEGSNVLEGSYKADIRCKQADKKVTVKMGNGIEAQVFPLGVYVNADLSDKIGLTKLSEENQKLHILLKGGKEVEASLCHGREGENTVLRAAEPIDTEKVTGVRMLGMIYELQTSSGKKR